ncbi:phage tail protein [Serratia marcescens]|uniref:phage tail protein n=1 Tax=Serratia marcescens TaxID=615 RepID=UPI000744DD05|nr:phage tail protein [Serratia marcescens]MBH2845017.1 phage tail protein [Serratia marcescens]MBH2864682.1 phage tail protein [Serratia marcescens]CVA41824.1 P2 phage tail completion protein R (GpR) [Serratia marcescens]CVG12712.1 P2 phage tail completion protein R (GpR) [Serratia marcescens]CVH41111.1 P2 phage tail completion protein R (GpR) [Serratia marcescens]
MSKLETLTAFLQANLPARVANLGFSSDMEEVSFINAQKDLGLNQYQMAVMEYEAVLSWGRFPYRQFDPRNLCALLLAWLIENADQGLIEQGFEPVLPELAIVVTDDKTALVEIALKMAEPLTLTQDEEGLIPFDGKRWRLADPEIWWALEGRVYGVGSTGAPIGETP